MVEGDPRPIDVLPHYGIRIGFFPRASEAIALIGGNLQKAVGDFKLQPDFPAARDRLARGKFFELGVIDQAFIEAFFDGFQKLLAAHGGVPSSVPARSGASGLGKRTVPRCTA
ncbi:hypothetical protein GAY29_17515 [Azospirillum brasilense]|nr:hypothetical protein [Azospirillum brasilense]